MPKYLVEARYTSEGAKGLAREGASGRRDAVVKTLESVGRKVGCTLLRTWRDRRLHRH